MTATVTTPNIVRALAEIFAGHDRTGAFPRDDLASLREAGFLRLTVARRPQADVVRTAAGRASLDA